MTNRPDLIDDALKRPGRLEVHKEIGLPNRDGRRQILDIHTEKMRKNGLLGKDVNLDNMAEKTKNFSGAEIEGLVRAAQSCAFNRCTAGGSKVAVDEEKILVRNYYSGTVALVKWSPFSRHRAVWAREPSETRGPLYFIT